MLSEIYRGVSGLWLVGDEISPVNGMEPVVSSSDCDRASMKPRHVVVRLGKVKVPNGISLRVLWFPRIMNLVAATLSPKVGA